MAGWLQAQATSLVRLPKTPPFDLAKSCIDQAPHLKAHAARQALATLPREAASWCCLRGQLRELLLGGALPAIHRVVQTAQQVVVVWGAGDVTSLLEVAQAHHASKAELEWDRVNCAPSSAALRRQAATRTVCREQLHAAVSTGAAAATCMDSDEQQGDGGRSNPSMMLAAPRQPRRAPDGRTGPHLL